MAYFVKGQFFYRCYSSASAGALRCGNYNHAPNTLSDDELLDEFENHRDLRNRVPTALVSVTVRPLEALHRAFTKCYASQEHPEDAEDIWIAILFVPDDARIMPHSALKLAQKSRECENPAVFEHEYLFVREIPPNYVEHIVSLKEMMENGLSMDDFLDAEENPPRTLSELKNIMRDSLIWDPYDAGRWFGGIARAFGAGAPMYTIAHKILSDCLIGHSRIDKEDQYLYFYEVDIAGNVVHSRNGFDFGSIWVVEEGIRDELDAWLGV